MLEELRKKVIRACKDSYKNGLVRNIGTGGNISARDKEENLIAITPSQTRYDDLEPEDIVLLNLKGEVIDKKSNLEPTIETSTHVQIYNEFDNVNGVVHTHSPFANAVAVNEDKIPLIHVFQPFVFGESIQVTELVKPGSENMADEVVNNLEEVPGTILKNHGPITVGDNLSEAVARAMLIEDCARIYYLSQVIGKPDLLPDDFMK